MFQQRQRSVAVIDNDPLARSVLCGVITRNVPSCRLAWFAESSQEALDKFFLGDGLPDIALIDMSMPDMPGADLCRKVRRKTDTVVLYGVTAFYGKTYAQQAAAAGAQGLLDKSNLSMLLTVLTSSNIGKVAPCFDIGFMTPSEAHRQVSHSEESTIRDLSIREIIRNSKCDGNLNFRRENSPQSGFTQARSQQQDASHYYVAQSLWHGSPGLI